MGEEYPQPGSEDYEAAAHERTRLIELHSQLLHQLRIEVGELQDGLANCRSMATEVAHCTRDSETLPSVVQELQEIESDTKLLMQRYQTHLRRYRDYRLGK